MLSLLTAVLEGQMRQGNVVRNVAALVTTVPSDPKPPRTLTAAEHHQSQQARLRGQDRRGHREVESQRPDVASARQPRRDSKSGQKRAGRRQASNWRRIPVQWLCRTLMHLGGAPIAVIAAWLGHASSAFTMATYVHSQDPALADAARRLARVVTSS